MQHLCAGEPDPLKLVQEVVLGQAPATQPAHAAGWVRISGGRPSCSFIHPPAMTQRAVHVKAP
jgi:hypothetical protein